MTTAQPAPLAIGKVTLIVHDLARVAAFYEQVIGLRRLAGDAASAVLGVDGEALLELRQDTAARRRAVSEAGLFHTAFLLPTRTALGSWLRHAAENSIPITGASDHDVSEALYLDDPEGNGIEIYVDRPRSAWRWRDGQVAMATRRLDLDELSASARGTPWRGAPAETGIGHVHLQVGALEPAEAFYAGLLGLDVTCRYRGATFYSANGYHHHLATNIWNSHGAPVREQPSTGLAEVVIATDGARLAAVAGRATTPPPDGLPARLTLQDPWGTAITLATT